MQKPDSEGFVNVTWPSRNVPHGGIFHTRVARPTENQQQFLKLLLEESKFNLELRQNRVYGLRTENRGQGSVSAAPTRAAPAPPSARPRTSRRRSLSAIRSSGIYDNDMYRPLKRGEDRERMKEKLANTMAYGDSDEQQPPPPPRLKEKPAPKLPTTKETWNDLVTQIRERAEWLAEMEWLGHAAPHREIVEKQIAERMRQLDALGVESVCTTARSTERSIARSSAASAVSPSAIAEKQREGNSSAYSKETKRSSRASGRKSKQAEENVIAYSQLTPLRYSPRRRL